MCVIRIYFLPKKSSKDKIGHINKLHITQLSVSVFELYQLKDFLKITFSNLLLLLGVALPHQLQNQKLNNRHNAKGNVAIVTVMIFSCVRSVFFSTFGNNMITIFLIYFKKIYWTNSRSLSYHFVSYKTFKIIKTNGMSKQFS